MSDFSAMADQPPDDDAPDPDRDGPAATPTRTGSQAVERALGIVTLFATRSSSELSLTEVAAAADLRPSTAHRLLRALARAGYLEQDSINERYRLGPTAALVGRAADAALGTSSAQGVVELLARDSGEAASIGMRQGDDVVILVAAGSDQPLRFERPPGHRTPLHASALGKALLAFDGRNSAASVAELDGPLAGFTDATITEPKQLVAELRDVRRSGTAVNREERYVGVAGLAVPVQIGDAPARIAIGLQVPSARLDGERELQLVDLLRSAAARLAADLAAADAVP